MSEQNNNPRDIQQGYYEKLGETDWDIYEPDEHQFLKRKIGFALFGVPSEIIENDTCTGYDKKKNEKIDDMYKLILENQYQEDSNVVLVRIIFIVYQNEKNEIRQTPVFVIKKCNHEQWNNFDKYCKIFMDELGRVYKSWEKYLENNKLPECTMYCPLNGQYSAKLDPKYYELDDLEYLDDDDFIKYLKVQLEIVKSPACNIERKVLDGADIAGTVLSVGSSTILVGSLIPAITVAPALLAGAAVTGVGVALYSVGRSIATLVERKVHKQTISLADRESRACWINASVGVLGASTCAATGLLTKAASNGRNISKSIQIAYNTLNITNMAGSAVGILFSGHNIIEKMVNNEPISPLEIYQFATSVLFFSKSTVDFRMAKTIISESQSTTIKNYEDKLRSNRHRKLFRKAQKEAKRIHGETKGNAEIISGISNIEDPNNYFAGLARINKQLNKHGARYTINSEGKVEINSNLLIDITEFATLSETDRTKILTGLSKPQPSMLSMPIETFQTKQIMIEKILIELVHLTPVGVRCLKDLLKNDKDLLTFVLEKYTKYAIEQLLKILVCVVDAIELRIIEEFNQLFPSVKLSVNVLQIIKHSVRNLCKKYNKDEEIYLKIFFDRNKITQKDITLIKNEVIKWIKNKILTKKVSKDDISTVKKRKINCKVCPGFYFVTI